MLAYAIARARSEGIGNIEWVHGSAMDLPLADGNIDDVCCCGALHLFPDPSRALEEIHRVLRPGGRFVGAPPRRSTLVELVPARMEAPSARYVMRVGDVSIEFSDDASEETLGRVLTVLRSC